MSISVIVPSCGRPTLEYTVYSVLGQIHPTEGDQLIVVSPRKPEIIEPHYDIRDDFIWIEHDNGGYDPETYRTLSKEEGYPSGGLERDIGRAVATGTHVMVIDDDDIFIPGALAAARECIEKNAAIPHIFRMQYGCPRQWISPCAKNLRKGWNRSGNPEFQWVLWGEPVIEIGNVGSAMYVLPNDPRLKWDCSAPGGQKNVSEDYWVLANFVKEIKLRPNFDPRVIGLIKPTAAELAEHLGIPKPVGLKYAPQPNWDGLP